jgi:hypothetical protein
MQLNPEVEQGFGQVLEALTGSKVRRHVARETQAAPLQRVEQVWLCFRLQNSIKASQQWFMSCGPTAIPGLARMMAVRCVASSTDTEKRLHLIYLTNDILFRGCGWPLHGRGT